MGILRNTTSNFDIYENQKEGILVAIDRGEASAIKAYFKKYKGKSNPPKETIKGHPFILDEEYDSLKIDFNKTVNYTISDLQKFKG